LAASGSIAQTDFSERRSMTLSRKVAAELTNCERVCRRIRCEVWPLCRSAEAAKHQTAECSSEVQMNCLREQPTIASETGTS
jgi:hypothetical protein